MSQCEQRLKELNVVLPTPPKAVGNYAPWIKTGNVIYTSGQLPWKNGEYGNLAYVGRIGSSISLEAGYECAKICAINAIAQLKSAVGDLDQVKKIIRIDGHILAADGFTSHSNVLDGASNLFNYVFGEKGMHTRSALGLYQSPLDAPVLIYVIAEF